MNNKLTYDQKGLTALVVLLLVVIIGAVGLTAWQVVNRQSEKLTASTANKKDNAATEQTNIPAKDKPKIPEGWKEYTSKEYGFSFAHPSKLTPQVRCQFTCEGYTVQYKYDVIELTENNAVISSFQMLPNLTELSKETVTANMGSGYGADLVVESARVAGVAGYKASIKNVPNQTIYFVKNASNQNIRISVQGTQASQIFETFYIK